MQNSVSAFTTGESNSASSLLPVGRRRPRQAEGFSQVTPRAGVWTRTQTPCAQTECTVAGWGLHGD